MNERLELPATRMFFLDWVRILAFFLLILYHVGMVYVTWDWHTKSPAASDAVEPFMMLSSPWRLSLLFFVSGVALSFLLARMAPGRLARRRSARLLVPLVFGMLVIVPAQPYVEVVEKLGYAGGPLEFMRLYLSAYDGFCREDCLILPTWNHLWFVAYLWVYTVAACALAALLGPRIDAVTRIAGRLLAGWGVIWVPVAVLGLARLTLAPHFEQTHALVDDWYSHAAYFTVFLLGAVVARLPAFWERVEALRWYALALALGSWAILIPWFAAYGLLPVELAERIRLVARVLWVVCGWCAIVAVCGFGRRHLQFDNPARRYLNEAVFPVYIAHQTLIVVLAHAFQPLKLAPGLEALLLVILTVVLSFGIFEAVRRMPLLRPVFGLAPVHPRAMAQCAVPSAA
ncbi:acyltransferase family protein [Massilia consociata]|uniref:Acyltransferase family protein n=1 Tax=Massilia consociata TaxID=760117 RepID=A0ABV6FD89_9BURK